MSPFRIVRAVLAAAALVAATALVAAQPAHAQPEAHLTCVLEFQATVDPPFAALPITPQSFDVEAAGSLADCVALSEEAEELESATIEATGSGTATLCALISTTGTGGIHWDNDTTSEFAYHFNLDLTDLSAGIWLTIVLTSGPLAGSFTAPVFVPTMNGTCVTGVTGLGAAAGAASFVEP